MSTTATPEAAAPAGQTSGAADSPPSVGQWGDLPPDTKKNGPNSKFAPELNATASESRENPGKARVISVQKSVRSASGRASTIKRKLKEGKVNGLEYPPDRFEIVPRGSVVYAIYRDPAHQAKAEPKPEKAADKSKPKGTAKPDPTTAARPVRPDPKK